MPQLNNMSFFFKVSCKGHKIFRGPICLHIHGDRRTAVVTAISILETAR